MSLVSTLFFAVNVSYFIVLDPATVAATNTVALDFGRVVLGRAGAVLFSILVSISAFGALNASFFTSASSRFNRYKPNADAEYSESTHLRFITRPFPAFPLLSIACHSPNTRQCSGVAGLVLLSSSLYLAEGSEVSFICRDDAPAHAS